MAFDFLDNWLDWGSYLRSPQILRLWAGIAILSTILNRHVWIRANSRFPPLFPNLFIMLAAPPRVGKDMAINAAARICREVNRQAQKKYGHPILHFGGNSISPKGLLDKLKEAELSDKLTPKYHSLSFFIPELTTVLPEYNSHLIGILNELWNCNEEYGESIRKIDYIIENPHITMLLGNQPSTLFNVFPESVFQMGFTSRVFFIFSDERLKNKIHLDADEEEQLDDGIEQKLIQHLLDLSQWTGQLKTTQAWRDASHEFDCNDICPVPGRRFEHWNGGRGLNLQKLSMCIAASEKSKTLDIHHWERAVKYLFEAEREMPRIFENVTTDRGFSEDLELIPRLANQVGHITHGALLHKLAKTRPPHEAANIINQAIKAGMLKQVFTEKGAPKKPLQYTTQVEKRTLQ